MKQVLLASVLAAAVSSVATLLLAEALRPPAALPAPDPGVAALRAALEETRRELAALRAAPPSAREGAAVAGPEQARPGTPAAAPGQGAAPAAGVKWEAIPVEEAAVAAEEPVRRTEPSAIGRSPDLVQKLRGFSGWDDDAEVRSRWILTPEEAVVDKLGKPDEIYVQESGVESWLYRVPLGTTDEDGDAEWNDVIVTFSRGRLIRVDD